MSALVPTGDPRLRALTPREIVRELDKYIVGQAAAKRAVAIALRNRWRRQQLPPELQEEVVPKNIILIGPTGVGKTEIARRLAKLANAPFIKCEASKFTEVGYVGRDVDAMVRDLMEVAIAQVRKEEEEKVQGKAREIAEERLLDVLVPPPPPRRSPAAVDAGGFTALPPTADEGDAADGAGAGDRSEASQQALRRAFRRRLRDGLLDDREVELDLPDRSAMPMAEIFSSSGMEEMNIHFNQMFGNLMGNRTKRRRVRVPEALDLLAQEEAARLVDMDAVKREAVSRAENAGIVFLDEIDKIAGREGGHGPDVSREGVQRDILPLVEGSTVVTKYGPVRTNHILFIAAGAFHVSKPSDLIPELQGRFPIRVELKSLSRDDFIRILTEPENRLPLQYAEMIGTEGVRVEFTPEAIEAIADIAFRANQRGQDIGARRLYAVMERLLDEVGFEAPDIGGAHIPVTPEYVRKRLSDVLDAEDLGRYIL